MTSDDEAAALAHQAALERRAQEEQRLLSNDPDYLKWLNELNEQVNHEIPRQSDR